MAGEIVEKWWFELPNKFKSISVDKYVVMPNHFHGIIIIVRSIEANQCLSVEMNPNQTVGTDQPQFVGADQPQFVGADLCVCPDTRGEHIGSPLHKQQTHCLNSGNILKKQKPFLPRIIQWFKTMTTNEYIHMVKQNELPPFNKKLWQRGYYEHVIRNEDKLNSIREYVEINPLRWHLDGENPERTGLSPDEEEEIFKK